MRAPPSGLSLTDADAAIVKGMLARGDRQHDIAAWFGVNGGRIAEVATGDKFSHVASQNDNLPPQGPYLSGRASHEDRTALEKLRQQLSAAVSEIDDLLGRK